MIKTENLRPEPWAVDTNAPESKQPDEGAPVGTVRSPSANDECFARQLGPVTPTVFGDGTTEGGKGGEGGEPDPGLTAGLALSLPGAPAKKSPPHPAAALLRSLWRSKGRVHQVGLLDRESNNRFRNLPVRSIDEAVACASTHCAAGLDVYLACAEYTDASTRTAPNVSCSYAFWFDVDCGPTKVEEGKGYAGIAQARVELERFCVRTGLPTWTHLVDSGSGLHAYWVLSRPLLRETWQAHARQLKALAQACGFLADPTRTSDIASVLRLPGTLNYKYVPPRPVRLLLASDAAISSESMLDAIRKAHETHCPPGPQTRHKRDQAANESLYVDDGNDGRDYGPPDLTRLAVALRRLDPDCDEATWKLHRLAPLAREARLHPEIAEQLYDLAKAWSSGELRGIPSQSWTRRGVNSGMTGAVAFEREWRRFLRGTYDGRSATLGSIYYAAKLAA